jgi:osmotically-inducible protein OsmY
MCGDNQLKQDVERELNWVFGPTAARIGVAVEDGVVTLTGDVETYADKLAAVKAAERTYQVRAVACEIEVRLPEWHERTDSDLARHVANVLAWNSVVPAGHVKVKVEQGWVTLSGDVDWSPQREAAVASVAPIAGVRGVENLIQVNPAASAEGIAEFIDAALRRSATLREQNIVVEAEKGRVALYGSVHSIPERDEAERIAWTARGVSDVANHLEVTVAEDTPVRR